MYCTRTHTCVHCVTVEVYIYVYCIPAGGFLIRNNIKEVQFSSAEILTVLVKYMSAESTDTSMVRRRFFITYVATYVYSIIFTYMKLHMYYTLYSSK